MSDDIILRRRRLFGRIRYAVTKAIPAWRAMGVPWSAILPCAWVIIRGVHGDADYGRQK